MLLVLRYSRRSSRLSGWLAWPEAFDPLVDLMEQFVGILRVGIALHRNDAFSQSDWIAGVDWLPGMEKSFMGMLLGFR